MQRVIKHTTDEQFCYGIKKHNLNDEANFNKFERGNERKWEGEKKEMEEIERNKKREGEEKEKDRMRGGEKERRVEL